MWIKKYLLSIIEDQKFLDLLIKLNFQIYLPNTFCSKFNVIINLFVWIYE